VTRDNQPRDVQEADATGGWWPSRYGPDDQAGARNEITPGVVRQAVTLVRHGPVYDLAHVLHQDVPAFPGRTFWQHLTTNYHQINRRGRAPGPRASGATTSTGSSLRRLGVDPDAAGVVVCSTRSFRVRRLVSCQQESLVEQGEAGAAIHLPLEHLDPVTVPSTGPEL
jgi:hypothetical protein